MSSSSVSQSRVSQSRVSQAANQVVDTGAAIIPGVFSLAEIERARAHVLAHMDLMKNTRPTPTSRHLAGFDQYPLLEPLHLMNLSRERLWRTPRY